MAFGPDGNLYVTDDLNRILRYNGASGAFIDVFASSNAEASIGHYFIFAEVPEPSAALLLTVGAAGLALVRSRMQSRQRAPMS